MKFDLKRLFAPVLCIFTGIASLLLMLVNYAAVALGLEDAALSGFDLIKFGDGSAKAAVEAVLSLFGKEVGGGFLFALISVFEILAIGWSAALILLGTLALLREIKLVDVFAKLKVDSDKACGLAITVSFALSMIIAICTLILTFMNLYKIDAFNVYVGFKTYVGFYILPVFSSLAVLAYFFVGKQDGEK